MKWACVFNELANLQSLHNVLAEFSSDTAIKAVLIQSVKWKYTSSDKILVNKGCTTPDFIMLEFRDN